MSTRGTVFVAVNGVSAGVTSASEARADILSHIGELVKTLVQDAPIAQLEGLCDTFGLAFELADGKLANVTFC